MPQTRIPTSPDKGNTASSWPWQSRWIGIRDGLRLHVRDHGMAAGWGGLPILCLSGLTRNSSDFAGIAARYGGNGARRVIAIDYRGRGRSDRDPDKRRYRPDVYLDDVVAVLDALGLHHVFVIGVSLGGVLAMALSLARPTALAGVALVDIGPRIESAGLTRIVEYVGYDSPVDNWDDAIALTKKWFSEISGDDAFWRQVAEGTFCVTSDGQLRVDWDTSIVYNLRKDKGIVPEFWPVYQSLVRIDTLILRGEHSTLLSTETAAQMVECHGRARLVTVAGVGHVPNLAEPEARRALGELLAAESHPSGA